MAYGAFGRRRDALFERCATLLTTGPVPALPLLSVQAHHQRRWGSLYDARAVGEISSRTLEQLLADHPLGRRRSDLRRRCQRLATLRCRNPPWACPLLSRVAPRGGAAHRRRRGVVLERPTRLRAGKLDRSAARAAAAPASEQQPPGRRADHCVPTAGATGWRPAVVRLRCWRGPGPTHAGPWADAGWHPGAPARGTLFLR